MSEKWFGAVSRLDNLSAVHVLEAMPQPAIVINSDGVILFANQPAATLFGYQACEMLNLPVATVGFGGILDSFQRSPTTETVFVDGRPRGGERVPLELSISTVATPGAEVSILMMRPLDRGELSGSPELATRWNHQVTVLQTVNEGVIIVGHDGSVIYANDVATRLAGHALNGLSGNDVRHLFPETSSDPGSSDSGERFLDSVLGSGETILEYETILQRPDGSLVDVVVNMRPLLDEEEGITGAAVSLHDVTQRKRMQSRYAVQEQVLEMIAQGEYLADTGRVLLEFIEREVSGTRAALYLHDLDTDSVDAVASPSLPHATRHPSHLRNIQSYAADPRLIGGAPLFLSDLNCLEMSETARDELRQMGLQSCSLYPIQSGDDGLRGLMCVYRESPEPPADDEQGVIETVLGLGRMIVGRLQLEREMSYQTFHDELTGLPNRILLMDRLDSALQRAYRSDAYLALLLLDLDQFQMVNDSLGHHAGDQLLRDAAGRLRDCLRSNDIVARFTSDEFAVLLEHIGGETDAVNVVMRIQRAFAVPLRIEGVDVYVSFSVGVALNTDVDMTPEHLVRFADIALNRAKESGHGEFALFTRSRDLSRIPKLEVQSRLHRALAADALELHYQPIMSLKTAEIQGYEALARWNDERFGVIPPEEFLPLAQHSGIMSEITAWVLDQAVSQLLEWQEQYQRSLIVGVNVSPRELNDPVLVEQVAAVIERYQLEPQSLMLEMTEQALIDRSERSTDILARLRALGVRTALDDFGTGYSSLAYLENFPVDCIKIDQSFIHSARGGASRPPVASAMVDLARTLGIISVAEGIETEEDERVARELGCDFSQGYYYGRPQPGSGGDQSMHNPA